MEWSEKRYWKLYLIGAVLMLVAFPFSSLWLGIAWLYWLLWCSGMGLWLYCYWRAFWSWKLKKAQRGVR